MIKISCHYYFSMHINNWILHRPKKRVCKCLNIIFPTSSSCKIQVLITCIQSGMFARMLSVFQTKFLFISSKENFAIMMDVYKTIEDSLKFKQNSMFDFCKSIIPAITFKWHKSKHVLHIHTTSFCFSSWSRILWSLGIPLMCSVIQSH